jgi:hypothetical protein
MAIDNIDRKPRLQIDVRVRTDPAEKPKRFAVTTNEDMLAVVDAFAGTRITKRTGATAEGAARFEHEHPATALGQ